MHFLCLKRSTRQNFNEQELDQRNSDANYRQLSRQRKHGVIGEVNVSSSTPIILFKKDEKTKKLIKNAILSNKFLEDLDESRIEKFISVMYPEEVKVNTRVIHEGETGSHLYVSEEGIFEIYVGNTYYGSFGPGVAFGELALLYNTKRQSSIHASTNGKLWVLDRYAFQAIMLKSNEESLKQNLKILRQIDIFRELPEEILLKICDIIMVEFYPTNMYVVREGERGDKFYIINSGSVRITKNKSSGMEEELMILEKGDYFGEKALYSEELCRQANAIAMAPGLECYTIEKK